MRIDLQGLNEDDLRQRVLMPLLSEMGYKGVDHYHGSTELGKDIVAWRTEADGSRENIAIVAKRGKISASATGDAGTVATQIRQAFGASFTDKITGQKLRIHKVIVAASGTIKEKSKKAILSQISHEQRIYVSFWDEETILDLIREYRPSLPVLETIRYIRNQFATLKHFDVETRISPTGVVHRVNPKVGRIDVARGVFEFPLDKEGKRLRDGLKRFVEAGEEVVIPGKYIKEFSKHDELQEIFGDAKPSALRLGSDKKGIELPIRLESVGNNLPFTYDNLILALIRRSGSVAEFASRKDPISIELRIRNLGAALLDAELEMNVSVAISGHPVSRAKQAIRLWQSLAEGGRLQLYLAGASDPLAEASELSISKPAPDLVAYIDDLVFISDMLGWNPIVPVDITEGDVVIANELRSIMETGYHERPLFRYKITFTSDADGDIPLPLLAGQSVMLARDREPVECEILERRIKLGPVTELFRVVLSSAEHVRVKKVLSDGGVDRVSVVFDADPDEPVVKCYYPQFLKGERRDEYLRLVDSR